VFHPVHSISFVVGGYFIKFGEGVVNILKTSQVPTAKMFRRFGRVCVCVGVGVGNIN
jgi:hypothetical protein